ncbi:MAG TPA: hypothetical protein VI277_08425 [Candidatus Limnocylindria bacterium]
MLTARRRAFHRDLGAIPLHPLFAAAYPVVFLFATNAVEQLTLAPLWLPLVISVGCAAIILVALGLLTRNWLASGLVTTVLVVSFFGYGHAWNAVSGALDSQWPLIIAWMALTSVALFFASGARARAPMLTRVLNVVTGFLLVLNIWGLGTSMIAIGALGQPARAVSPIDLAPADTGDLPDVYYIIVDRYGGSTALAETYGFDNEPFLNALEERGFAVARHAHANYIKTPLSVVSSLDMEYLDAEALKAEATDGSDRGPIQRRLGQHRVVPTALKELGYSYYQLGNWWTPTQTNVDADRVFRYQGQDEFSSVLLQTTLMRALSDPHAAPDDPWDWSEMRANNLYALDRLEDITSLPGPKYVFAHLVTTHPPYVHNVDGSMTGRAQVARLGDIESYVRQLQYANTRLLGIMDAIVANDPDAVIMLQADEGPFPERYDADDWAFRWSDATDAEVEQKFGILYAMRVPGADVEAAGLRDDSTPVNAFRIIFNARFGTDLEILPDHVYAHTDLRHFYDFIDLTDRVQ